MNKKKNADTLHIVNLCTYFIYISLFVCKHSTNTYIHKILRLLIREGKKSNKREEKIRKKLKHYKTAFQISKMSNQV